MKLMLIFVYKIQLNKRFITSFLHIQGKIITKIGYLIRYQYYNFFINTICLNYSLESLHNSSTQMLKEFRALLQHSPLAITSHRLIQIWSLNMYTISCTQKLKGKLYIIYTFYKSLCTYIVCPYHVLKYLYYIVKFYTQVIALIL